MRLRAAWSHVGDGGLAHLSFVLWEALQIGEGMASHLALVLEVIANVSCGDEPATMVSGSSWSFSCSWWMVRGIASPLLLSSSFCSSSVTYISSSSSSAEGDGSREGMLPSLRYSWIFCPVSLSTKELGSNSGFEKLNVGVILC